MATRRGFSQVGYSSPPTPMTPKGGSGMMYSNTDDDDAMMGVETPDQFRRRTTPATDMPMPQMPTIEEWLTMLTRGSS